MSEFIVIQDEQITSTTKHGIHYKDDASNEQFINFDACYKVIVEIYNDPNIRKMFMQPRYRNDYLTLLDALKTKKIVGLLSPNGGLFEVNGDPRMSIGFIKIEFASMRNYVALREKLLIRDIHFIIGFFEVI